MQSFYRFRSLTLLIALIALLFIAGACGDDDSDEVADGDGNGAITRSPQTDIVIPPGEPIVIGVSTALTGDLGVPGLSAREATVVSVEARTPPQTSLPPSTAARRRPFPISR